MGKLLSVNAHGPGDRALGGRAPGAGGELRWRCLESMLPRAPGVWRAHRISAPASDRPAERAGDGLRDAAGPRACATVCETVMQPQDDHLRCGTCRNSGSARCRTRSSGPSTGRSSARCRTRSSGRSSRTVWKDVTYTVCRPVRETHMETRTYTVCRPVRETTLKTCVYNVCHAGPRGHATRSAATPSAGRCRRPS